MRVPAYTTVQDAPVDPKVMPLYRKAADEGRSISI